MATDKQSSRLFFALWPSEQVRQSIVDVFSAVAIPENSRVLQSENLHITLHFLVIPGTVYLLKNLGYPKG